MYERACRMTSSTRLSTGSPPLWPATRHTASFTSASVAMKDSGGASAERPAAPAGGALGPCASDDRQCAAASSTSTRKKRSVISSIFSRPAEGGGGGVLLMLEPVAGRVLATTGKDIDQKQ